MGSDVPTNYLHPSSPRTKPPSRDHLPYSRPSLDTPRGRARPGHRRSTRGRRRTAPCAGNRACRRSDRWSIGDRTRRPRPSRRRWRRGSWRRGRDGVRRGLEGKRTGVARGGATYSSSDHALPSAQAPSSARPVANPALTRSTTLRLNPSFRLSSVVSSSPTILSCGKDSRRWSEMRDCAARSPTVTGDLSGFVTDSSTVRVSWTDLVLTLGTGTRVSCFVDKWRGRGYGQTTGPNDGLDGHLGFLCHC